jgi:hypothetical protein
MIDQQEQEFTAPEAVSISVAPVGDLPDKLLLTVWANGPQRFILSRRMANFLGKAIAESVEKLSLPPDEH